VTSHPVDIWKVALSDAMRLVLSAEEAERAARFRFPKDRERWSRARSALRMVLAKYARVQPDELRFAIGPHGKPALVEAAGIEFNLSHARDYALVAVSRNVPVGVDIQDIRPGTDMALLLRRLGESGDGGTAELYARWARREARSKAAGGALFDPLPPDIRAVDLPVPEGYAAAVALCGFEPCPARFELSA